MAKRTKVQKESMCLECGTLEPSCNICDRIFSIKNRPLICDSEPDGYGHSGNHYCLRCYKKLQQL